MNEMSIKERLLNAIRGKEVDQIPWSPFLAYYWEHLPDDIQKRGQAAYMAEIGADPLLRGFHALFEKRYHNVEHRESIRGKTKEVIYETKVGSLREVYTYVEDANTWFLTRHPVEEAEDLKILMYLFENLDFQENKKDFLEDYKQIGDQGLYLPVIGADLKTAFQSLVEHWVGTENLVYMLYDEPEKVEECLEIMREKDLETVKISLDSPAEGFIFWEDSSTTNINPDMFKKYTMPEINQWGALIHKEGKLLVHHACGHIKDLLPLMRDTEIDAVESVTPFPTGNVNMIDAKKILEGSGKSLIGGIEPTFLLNSTLGEMEAYVMQLIREMGDRNFVLANSDSCPPGVSEEKFRLVSKMLSRKRE